MTNAEKNKQFLSVVDAATKSSILGAIAAHYGTTPESIYEEVTDPDAENILDYMVGGARIAAHVIYQRHGFTL